MKYNGFDIYDDNDNLIESLPAILYSEGAKVIAQVPSDVISVDFLDQSGSIIQTSPVIDGKAALDITGTTALTVRVGNPTITKLNEVTFTPTLPPKTLDEVKQDKISELQVASDNATATFKSSALGSEKTYLADEKSMTFLAAEYAFVKSPDYDGSTTDWFTVEDGNFVTHTGVQIAQVFLDGRAWIKEQKTVKLKALFAGVEEAQTIDDVIKITW